MFDFTNAKKFTNDEAKKACEILMKEFAAMQSPEKWTAHKKEQINSIVGQMDMAKCEQFAKFLNIRFIEAVKAVNGFAMASSWANKSSTEKIALAQQIVNTLVGFLQQDIASNRVAIYKNDGELYNPQDSVFDSLLKDDISKNPEIKVSEGGGGGLMAVSPNGDLKIDLDWPMYRDLGCFLMDLRHEMMHVVDIFFPNISSLAPDVRKKALHYYVDARDDKNLYSNNPLEVNANLLREEFAYMCGLETAKANANRAKTIEPVAPQPKKEIEARYKQHYSSWCFIPKMSR